MYTWWGSYWRLNWVWEWEERLFAWLWMWHVCWRQMARSVFFTSCWSTGIFPIQPSLPSKRPPQTPGLSLIEHFWEVVKQHIQFMDWQGTNLQQLQNAKIIPIPINVCGILWNLCSASEQCSNKEHLMETLVYVYIAHQSQLQVKI